MENKEEIKRKISTLNLYEKVYSDIVLPHDQQLYERAKPQKYLEATLRLFDAIGGRRIVELGCMRKPLIHPISEFHPSCCNDGHSTYYWSTSAANVVSVDISWKSVLIAKWSCRKFENTRVIRSDGIKFLQEFDEAIDLLFLDAWDVKPGIDYAEKHLIAYETAKSKLNKTNIISIDDTDIGGGGKGRLLIPALQEDNYEILVSGRQTIAILEN